MRLIQLLLQDGDLHYYGKTNAVEKSIYFEVIQSRIFELNGQFDRALMLATQAQEVLEGEDLAFAHISAAYANWRLNRYENGFLSCKIARELLGSNNDYLISNLLNIEGLLYWKQGNHLEKALQCFNHAAELRLDGNWKSAYGYSLNNLGNTYLKLGRYDECLKYYSKAFDLRNSLGSIPAIAASHNSLGRYHDAIGQFDQAKTYHRQCLKLWQKVGNIQFIAKAHRFLGINLKLQGKTGYSKELINAIELFRSIGNEIDEKITLYLLDNS